MRTQHNGRVSLPIALTAILALFLSLALNACGGDSGNEDGNSSSSANGGNSSSSGGSSSSNIVYADKGNNIASYDIVPIGEQTWMAENLNYNVEGSKCYGEGAYNITLTSAEIQANCDKYGRLYGWAVAMALPSSCAPATCSDQIDAKHKGICPSGWHIPSIEEWDVLIKYVDPNFVSKFDNVTGDKLKAASGWEEDGNGTDDHGFSALPNGIGGYVGENFKSHRIGCYGFWWSISGDSMHLRCENSAVGKASYAGGLFSVRCLKN
ncbi:MAG: hypothetical protein LBH25_12735 [Fibromonadaceae bacterium]|jgi:uncharacterized protein (TIGR02145 family)|nr:hypothetical protein [Fibromonadaceae bacterium]